MLLFLEVYGVHETFHHIGAASVIALVLTDFARFVVEWTRLSYLHRHELYHYVHWRNVAEVVGEMRSYAKRRLTIVNGILLNGYRRVS